MQNLVFQLRAPRLPAAGRTVAVCGLSGPQLRDEVSVEGKGCFCSGITTLSPVYARVLSWGYGCSALLFSSEVRGYFSPLPGFPFQDRGGVGVFTQPFLGALYQQEKLFGFGVAG